MDGDPLAQHPAGGARLDTFTKRVCALKTSGALIACHFGGESREAVYPDRERTGIVPLVRVSLDTAGDEPAYDREFARLMQDKPLAPTERVKLVRRRSGNLVQAVAR